MTRSAPVLALRHAVMVPEPLAGMAPYAAAPTPISPAAAIAETAANVRFLVWNMEISWFGSVVGRSYFEPTTTRAIGVSRGGRGGAGIWFSPGAPSRTVEVVP